ncbi:MAG TPA: hypothetical protein VME17_17775 [Bryobacteraceae bacterium]|nr:hypothetical protein [Bryobacteraceae bacterium]
MLGIKKWSFLSTFLLLTVSLFAQAGATAPATTSETAAIPRLPDGKPDLNGVWNHPYVPDMAKSSQRGGMSQEGPGELPFTPEALAAFQKYNPAVDGDYTGSCLPFGYLRSFNAPYPIQIMQTPKYLSFLFEQNTWFHVVRMNQEHPADLNPTWFGDSVGKWDGDTLVIDTIGFNGKTRLDTVGHPHSDALHVIQELRRLDGEHLYVKMTIIDPKTFTKPWSNTRVFQLMKPGQELMEYSCEENNRDFTQGHIKEPVYNK